MQLSVFLCLQEQAAKEALAAELAARGIVVEEGKKKVRNTFGQSNFLFTILSWIVWLSVAVSKHRNEDVMKTPRARHLLKHRQKPHTTCWNGRYSLVLSHTIQNKLVLWTLHVHSEPDVQTNMKAWNSIQRLFSQGLGSKINEGAVGELYKVCLFVYA